MDKKRVEIIDISSDIEIQEVVDVEDYDLESEIDEQPIKKDNNMFNN